MTIELRNVFLKKGAFTLSCNNLVFEKGKVTGIIGRNGSGKSTLLKIINGALKPEKGKVMIGGKDVAELSPIELSRRMSFVQQEIFDPFSFTVRDVLSVSAYSRGGNDEELVKALQECEIEHLVNRKFSELSGGERRLVTLSCAIYQDAEIMLLDEPTTFLDVDKELLIHKVIGRLKDMGKTVVVVMHNISAIHSIADNVVLMGSGTVIDYGDASTVMSQRNLMRTFGVEFDVYDTSGGKAFVGKRAVGFR